MGINLIAGSSDLSTTLLYLELEDPCPITSRFQPIRNNPFMSKTGTSRPSSLVNCRPHFQPSLLLELQASLRHCPGCIFRVASSGYQHASAKMILRVPFL